MGASHGSLGRLAELHRQGGGPKGFASPGRPGAVRPGDLRHRRRRLRDGQKKAEQREEDRRILLQEMLEASDQQIRQAAEEAAQQAAAGLSAEVQGRLAIYLMQVPVVARQSLRRPDDPSGTSVPAGRSLSRPEDVLPLLPTRTPRFKIGDRPLPGVDWELEQLLGVGFAEVWKAPANL
jgi:hypothetical protein